jgi:ACS family hexuronate transporter-like MFS transporter
VIAPARPRLGVLARWSVVGVATLAMSVSYIDRQAIAALAQSVRDALFLSHEAYGWIAGAFSIAYLLMAPVAGAVVDRVGARRGLLFAVLAWSVVAAAHALVSSFAFLFALRIALGTAEAPSFPAATQSARRVLPRDERSAGLGMIFTGSLIGAAVAGPLTVALKARWGWQLAFVGSALAGLSWIPLWLMATRSPEVRAVLAQPEEMPAGRAKATRLEVLSDPAVLRAVVLVLLSAPAMSFSLLWFPQFLEKTYAVAENDVGSYIWVGSLGFAVGAVAVGAIASARDAQRRGVGGVASHADLIAVAAALATTLALLPLAPGPWVATAIGGAAMLGGGALYARLTADMMARIDPSHVSMAGGLTAAAQSLAYVVTSPVVGRVVDRTHTYSAVLVVLGLLNVPGALAWLVWPTRRVGRRPDHPANDLARR